MRSSEIICTKHIIMVPISTFFDLYNSFHLSENLLFSQSYDIYAWVTVQDSWYWLWIMNRSFQSGFLGFSVSNGLRPRILKKSQREALPIYIQTFEIFHFRFHPTKCASFDAYTSLRWIETALLAFARFLDFSFQTCHLSSENLSSGESILQIHLFFSVSPFKQIHTVFVCLFVGVTEFLVWTFIVAWSPWLQM